MVVLGYWYSSPDGSTKSSSISNARQFQKFDISSDSKKRVDSDFYQNQNMFEIWIPIQNRLSYEWLVHVQETVEHKPWEYRDAIRELSQNDPS